MPRTLRNYISKSFLSFDGAKIYYELTDGAEDLPTLLFIHGLGGDLTAWDEVRSYFQQKGYATIALDLRGHGLSQRSTEKDFYSFGNFAQDIVALREHEKLKNVVVIGHSFGGIIALILEGKYKMKARGLVLVDTGYKSPDTSQPGVDSMLIQFFIRLVSRLRLNIGISGHVDFRKYVGTGDYDKRRILSDILHTSLETYLLIFSNVLQFDGEKLLKEIAIPTLIVEGEEDSVVPVGVSKMLHKKIKTSQLEIIPGANHIIVLNNPVELSKAMYSFVKKL